MHRDIHMKPSDLLASLQFREGDFGKIALVSGQAQRAKMSLDLLEKSVKNFTFLDYTFWTGLYGGKKVTVGNGGFYAPDSAFITELLCAGGIDIMVRLGSCGALREDISIGDFVVVDNVLRGDGATRYYVDDDFSPTVDAEITRNLVDIFSSLGRVHTGGIWTTDALFRETKEIVNPYIEKGAIAVDMVTSPFVTVSTLYKRRSAAVLVVSDNLITGELGFTDFKLFEAQDKMVQNAFKVIGGLNG